MDEAAVSQAAKLDGIYLLGTTLKEYSMGTVFSLFKEQHYSESANKDLKGPLRIRPIFLQNQDRIESLIFILFLALMVYMLIERWYRNSVKEPSLKRGSEFTDAQCAMRSTTPSPSGLSATALSTRKTTTRTLLAVFRNYALTVIVTEEEMQKVPNSLSTLQEEIFSVLGLKFSEIYHGFT